MADEPNTPPNGLDHAAEFDAGIKGAQNPPRDPAPAGPAPQPTTPAETAVTSPPEAPAAADDPWATAPEPLRKQWADAKAELEAERLKLKRTVGKLRQTQDELLGLKRPAPSQSNAQPARDPGNKSSAEATSQTAPAPAPTAADDEASYFDSPDWKELERDYPEEAKRQRNAIETRVERAEKAYNRRIKELETKIENLSSEIVPAVSEIRSQREIAALEKVHPDWRDIDQDPEFDVWFEELPEKVRDGISFNNANDVTWLLTQFKRDQALADNAAAESAAADKPAPSAAVTKATERRAETLKANVVPKVAGAAVARVHSANLTPAEDFDAYVRADR